MIRKIRFFLLKALRGLFFKPQSKIHGEATWLSKDAMADFFKPSNLGIILSPKCRLPLSESYKNLCLLAPTGGGKTTRYVIPNILNASGSVVVTDPAGEIHALTHKIMKERGYNIQVIQPADLDKSLRFNPLAYISNQQELKQLSKTLATQNTGNEPFWNTEAANIINLCLQALIEDPDPSNRHLGTVRQLLVNFQVDGKGETGDYLQTHLPDKAFAEYKSFLSNDSKLMTGVITTSKVGMELWNTDSVEKLTAQNTVDIGALRDKNTIIYLIVPEDKLKFYSVILSLFYSACFSHCIHNAGNPVFYFLDEFGNLPQIPNFSEVITTLRKRKCSISLILQSLSQIESVYGRTDAKTILDGGCGNKLFYPALGLDSCLELERLLGARTEYDLFLQSGDLNERANTVAVPLLRHNEIRMMDSDSAIFLSGNKAPIKLKTKPYFQQRQFGDLTQEHKSEESQLLQFKKERGL